MADDSNIDLDDLADGDLRRTLAETREDIDRIQRMLQDLAMVQDLIERAESEGFDSGSQTVADLMDFLSGELDVDGDVMDTLQDAVDAFMQAEEAESADAVSAEDLRDWVAEQGAEAGDGDGQGDDGGDGDGDGNDGPTMEDLEAAKATIAEFNDHMEDVKDLLQEYREETTEQIESLERRLSDVEEEPQQQSQVGRKMTDFHEDLDDEDGTDREHEDVML